MSDIAIHVRNASKRFKLYGNPITGPLLEFLMFWKRTKFYKEFIAVNNVSLEIRRGEVFGIIGANGAGKTTLLKMIAGLLPVDGGSIEVRGKVTALLALGVGIHPEFSGRENIYYSSLLLGMERDEIHRKMDHIIEFAELGDFIDQPFRTYSSGMRSRLLFSIAMSIDPDILIIDEALATGDDYFVKKGAKRIRELCKSGATILFVSHNLNQIQEFCSQAAFLNKGKIASIGETTKVIADYKQTFFDQAELAIEARKSDNDFEMTESQGFVIDDVKLTTEDGIQKTSFSRGEAMQLRIRYRHSLPAPLAATTTVRFHSCANNEGIGEFKSVQHFESLNGNFKRDELALPNEGTIAITFDPLMLGRQYYYLSIKIHKLAEQPEIICSIPKCCMFFSADADNPAGASAHFWQPGSISCLND